MNATRRWVLWRLPMMPSKTKRDDEDRMKTTGSGNRSLDRSRSDLLVSPLPHTLAASGGRRRWSAVSAEAVIGDGAVSEQRVMVL
ncbi:hypothetical protein Dimus_024389, partial [Dionaea muscipula]